MNDYLSKLDSLGIAYIALNKLLGRKRVLIEDFNNTFQELIKNNEKAKERLRTLLRRGRRTLESDKDHYDAINRELDELKKSEKKLRSHLKRTRNGIEEHLENSLRKAFKRVFECNDQLNGITAFYYTI
jgi:chromosome segregation ATPase